MLVADLLAAPTEIVVATKLEHVGHQVIGFNDEILDHGVDLRIRHLDPGDWHISDVLEDSREDNLAEILDKMLLEHRLAILVIAKVKEQLLNGQAERLVLRILVKLVTQELDLIDDAVRMITVTLTKQIPAMIIEFIPLILSSILHDEALFLEALAYVCINALEPFPKFGILIGITIDVVDGFEEVVSRSAVRESFDECLELSQHGSILTQIPWRKHTLKSASAACKP